MFIPLLLGLNQRAPLSEPQFSRYGNRIFSLMIQFSGFGGLEVSVLAFGTQIQPVRRRRIFRAEKSSARLPSEVK